MAVKKKEINWRTDVKYDVVQFDLVNPTSSDVEINLFDSNERTLTPTENLPFAPIANQSQLSVSGTSPVLAGIAYMPNQNYLFISENATGTGKRVVWDITNNIQVSEYTVAVANGINGIMQQRPSDGKVWGLDDVTANLVESDWVGMTQTLHPITGLGAASGVLYDEVTDTLYFGYAALNSIGAFHIPTNTLTNISTPSTFNFVYSINNTTRRLYSASVANAFVAEIDINTNTVIQEVDFSSTGLIFISGLVVDNETNKIFAVGSDGVSTFIGVLDLNLVTFTPIITSSFPSLAKVLNLQITQGKLFVYDVSVSVANTVTIINVSDNAVINNQSPVGGTGSGGGSAFVVAPDQALYATKGTGGTVLGDLTVLPIPSQFYIKGSTNYNFFRESIYTAPKRVFAIEFDLDLDDMKNPFTIVRKDANGQECEVPYLPNNYTTNFQFDGREAVVDFEGGYIVDINSHARYKIPANTTVIILVWYKEMKRSEKLIEKADFSKDFSKGTNGEAGLAKETINQQDQTGEQVLGGSGRNVMNYWIPTTMMVDTLVEDDGMYPEGWKDFESMIPQEMIIERNT